jgi:quinol monooxygenase YgiN
LLIAGISAQDHALGRSQKLCHNCDTKPVLAAQIDFFDELRLLILRNLLKTRICPKIPARAHPPLSNKFVMQMADGRAMLVPTCAESGCKLCELYESNVKGRFYFYERWESQAALKKHTETPHYKHLEQAVAELLQQPFEENVLTSIQAGAAA